MFSSVSQTKQLPQAYKTFRPQAKSSSAFHWLRGREISYRPPSSEKFRSALISRNIETDSFSKKEQICSIWGDGLDVQEHLGAGFLGNGEHIVTLWDLRTNKIRWKFNPEDVGILYDYDLIYIRIVPKDDDVEKGYVFLVFTLQKGNNTDPNDFDYRQALVKINIKCGMPEADPSFLSLIRVTTRIKTVGERIFGLSGSHESQPDEAKPHFYEIDRDGKLFPLSKTLLMSESSLFDASEEFLVSTLDSFADLRMLIDFKHQIYVHDIKGKKTEALFLGATKLLSEADIAQLFLDSKFDELPKEVKFRIFTISVISLNQSELICALSNRSSPNDPILCAIDLKTRKIVYKYPPKDFDPSLNQGSIVRSLNPMIIETIIKHDSWVYVNYFSQARSVLMAFNWSTDHHERLLEEIYLFEMKINLKEKLLFFYSKLKLFIFNLTNLKLIYKDVGSYVLATSSSYVLSDIHQESYLRMWDFLSQKDKDDRKPKRKREDEKKEE